jgi:hypothetical protein
MIKIEKQSTPDSQVVQVSLSVDTGKIKETGKSLLKGLKKAVNQAASAIAEKTSEKESC